MKRRRRHDPPFSLFAFQDIITSVTGILLLMTLLLTLALITRELDSPNTQSIAVAKDVSDVLEQTRREINQLRARVDAGQEQVAAIADYSEARVRRELHELEQTVETLELQLLSLRARLEKTEVARNQWKAREFDSEKERQRIEDLQAELAHLKETQQQIERDDRLIYNPQRASGKTAWLVDVDDGRLVAARLGVSERPREFAGTDAFLAWTTSRNPRQEYFVLLVRPAGIEAYYSIVITLHESLFEWGVDLLGQDQTVIDPETGVGAQT